MVEGAVERMLIRAIQESNIQEIKRNMENGPEYQTTSQRIRGYVMAVVIMVPIIALMSLFLYPISLMMTSI